MRGQPDLMILDYHKDYKGLCIEFKSPTNNYNISEAQLKMKEKYRNNGYTFILSNDYDKISKNIHKYMAGVRIPCKYCTREFRNQKTLNKHYKVIHRIEKKSNFYITYIEIKDPVYINFLLYFLTNLSAIGV